MDKELEKLIGSMRQCTAYVEKKTDLDNRRITFCINAEEIDRHGDVVTQEAIVNSIKGFGMNPICLPCHQHYLDDGTPPTVGSWDVESFKTSGKKCLLDLVFSTGKLGELYFAEYVAGHMRAVSIGFRILDAHTEMQNGKNIYVITKIELYEISCVAVGANRAALAKKGIELKDESDLKSLVHEAVKEALKPMQKEIKDFLEEKFSELNILGFGKQSYLGDESDDADDFDADDKDYGTDDEDGEFMAAVKALG